MKLLSLARDLRRRKARERQSAFVVEGVRATEELIRSSLSVKGVLVAPQLIDAPRGQALLDAVVARGVAVEEVSARDFATAAETESPQGVLGIAAVPDRSFHDVPATNAPLLVLDGVQDPGNAGTLLRTAAALGARATVALPGTVDLWNAKVVRSSVGAQFAHLAFSSTWEALAAFLAGTNTELWAAAADGTPIAKLPHPPRVAIAVGNEGAGVSAAVAAAAARRVAIPITSGAESLNVGVAAGILLYELRSR